MKCDVIRDLLPLYIDDCCSAESEKTVEEHIEICAVCKSLYENLKTDLAIADSPVEVPAMWKLDLWKASVLQSVLLFVSFALITVGVAREAGTPTGFFTGNGFYAFNLVVPFTGFMLSLANWYFLRQYKSRKVFSHSSAVLTLIFILCAVIFTGIHYKFTLLDFIGILDDASITDMFEMIPVLLLNYGIGFILSIVLCFVSKKTSYKYAEMLGKE